MKNYLWVFFFLLAPAVLAAEEPLTVPDKSCACNPHASDSYEEPVRFAFGPFRGKCIDSCRFRHSRLLGVSADAEKKIELTNFLHRGKYWLASIPVRDIRSVNVLFEDFFHGVSHVSLRFDFSRPVKLRSQEAAKEEVAQTLSLIISAEAAYTPGGKINLLEGALGHYILAHRLLSTEEMKATVIDKAKHSVRQFRLRLTKAQQMVLLTSALEKSDREGFRSVYWLFTDNCATNATSLLQQSAGLSAERLTRRLRGVSVNREFGTMSWLLEAGLVDGSVSLPSVEDERL